MLARLIAVVIDEIRQELRKLDEPGLEVISVTAVDGDVSDQTEPAELRFGFGPVE